MSDVESCGSESSHDISHHVTAPGNEGSNEGHGEFIAVPFLANGYDWRSLVTTTDEATVSVAPDHLPEVGLIEETFVVNRCIFLNLELTNENKQKVKDLLEAHLHSIKRTLKKWVQHYWVEVANSLDIKFGTNFDVTNFSELQAAVRQCKTWDVAKKIVICLYLSFDFCGNYRKKVAKCLLLQFGLKLDERKYLLTEAKECGTRKSRKKRNCFEKLVTQIITEQRKNVNNLAIKTCGVTFTNQRPGDIITVNTELDYRKKRRFYDWMILGQFVSTSLQVL